MVKDKFHRVTMLKELDLQDLNLKKKNAKKLKMETQKVK